MQKYSKFILVFIGIATLIAGIYFFFMKPTTKNNSNSGAQRLSYEENLSSSNSLSENEVKNHDKLPPNDETSENAILTETELASSSTDILIDDDNRDNNLELSASKINNYIVKNNEEFSFNKVVGNPTPDRGYEKAGIFVNGKKQKGYGGGNCQISSTLYDAVLKVDGLNVTERHEHGKEVGYIRQGNDATVVYDELDLKFKNNTGNDIKIYSSVTKDEVRVKIVKLSNS